MMTSTPQPQKAQSLLRALIGRSAANRSALADRQAQKRALAVATAKASSTNK